MKEWILEKEDTKKRFAVAGEDEELPAELRKAREKSLYYLQFSAKTEEEMRKKLKEGEFSPAAVEDTILFLKHYRYLDDETYVKRYTERNREKKSLRQIRYDLGLKGIAKEVIQSALDDMDVDEVLSARALLKKRNYDPETADSDQKRKHAAYLARKGFSYEIIRMAMKDEDD